MDLDETLLTTLREAFNDQIDGTVGLEEEVMLLDTGTLDLNPRAEQVVAAAASESIKTELPASQIELVTPPTSTAGQTASQLHALRNQAYDAATGIGRLAASGVHPFAAPDGPLSEGEAYDPMAVEYVSVARRQLVFGMHIHVAIRGLDRALAVYNELRTYLPELAALSATAPFHAGIDTGLQSVRPKISENLPRQGIPPAFESTEALAEAMTWAVGSGAAQTVRQWWWELRLHPRLGTVEIRVCDSQPTVERAAALVAVTQSLCLHLASQYDEGKLPPPAPTWRIEQNRWSACRHGIHGRLADPRSARVTPTRDRLTELLDLLTPAASGLHCTGQLLYAHRMIQQPAADLYRALEKERGLYGLVEWMAGEFLADPGRASAAAPAPLQLSAPGMVGKQPTKSTQP